MFWDSSPKNLAIFCNRKNCQNMTAIPFLTVGLSKKSKSIRPNRLCLNSCIGLYRSLQCGHLELSRTCRNDVGISIFLFDHTMPNLTGTTLRKAPVQKYQMFWECILGNWESRLLENIWTPNFQVCIYALP